MQCIQIGFSEMFDFWRFNLQESKYAIEKKNCVKNYLNISHHFEFIKKQLSKIVLFQTQNAKVCIRRKNSNKFKRTVTRSDELRYRRIKLIVVVFRLSYLSYNDVHGCVPNGHVTFYYALGRKMRKLGKKNPTHQRDSKKMIIKLAVLIKSNGYLILMLIYWQDLSSASLCVTLSLSSVCLSL